jgi:LysR family hydrogen peroxide-inducible transcriptional activator
MNDKKSTAKVQFTLTQLEYVLAIYKTGHFAKAAELCNVTQPTLSMQLQKLEEEMGLKLFDRSKKPILLTEEGQRLIEQIQKVVFEAKRLTELTGSVNNNSIEGEIVLGIIPTIAPYLLPRLLPVLEKKNPDLGLQIVEMQTHQILDALEKDEINVGLLATPLKIPKVFEFPLYYEPFSIFCKKDHELSQQKKVKYNHLKFEDIWLLQEGHCLRNQMVDICSLKQNELKSNKFRFESGSLETLKNLVNSYGGYTLIPWLANDEVHKNSVIVPFERPIPAREIGLVYRREFYKGELIEALGQAILSSIPPELAKIRKKDLDVIPVDS